MNIFLHSVKTGTGLLGWTRGGLSRLTDGHWAYFETSDGFSHNPIHSITEESGGKSLVGTMQGLNRFRDVNITAYTTREGLKQ